MPVRLCPPMKSSGWTIRAAEKSDEAFLWHMLFQAAHMDEDGETSLDAAKTNEDLRRYVDGWPRPTDVGSIAHVDGAPIGAAWLRLLVGDERTFSYLDDHTPELAIATRPEWIGRGVGTALLRHVLER